MVTTFLAAGAAIFLLGEPKPAPLRLEDPVRDKNFYALALARRIPSTRRMLSNDSALAELTSRRRTALRAAKATATLGSTKGLDGLKWGRSDVELVGGRLAALSGQPGYREWIDAVRSSGVAYRWRALSDRELGQKVWRDSAAAMDSLIDVYGLQTAPARSASIDGPLYKADNPFFGGLVKTMLGVTEERLGENPLFFEPNLEASVGMLGLHVRDEAGRHEPMEAKDNRVACRQVAKTDFSRYRYTAMLVPGFGPEEAGVRLSPAGRLACELAARRWKQKLAPFIIVSGGYVHPNQTPFSEAVEMKRCLVDDWGIPGSAVFIDPHARHTTTNVRNAVRIAYRSGIPVDQPMLVVTNTFQSHDIESPAFARRCQGVFGYVPGDQYKRIDEFTLSFRPLLDSLTMDAGDPLDP